MSESALSTETKRDYGHLVYPEKIMIPEKIHKRGRTYKLNDCYYDHDAYFICIRQDSKSIL
ncbi:hypothetical protein NQ317_008379 [Molorchus minor]|uniref:Uncharacterized protein n=1 Tax=Molorchus minor TaxID=1323400 RepID=A0ABQ9K4J7_9CUCU|nr:hypothetical protein NQ317_008379 [Molorchus minor]